MKNYLPLKITTIILGILALVLTVSAVLVNRPESEKSLKISGKPSNFLSSASTSEKETFATLLFSSISPLYSLENNSEAIIRNGTYTESETETGNILANFILDIPSIEQSLSIYYLWSSNPENSPIIGDPLNIYCAPKDLTNYPDSTCRFLSLPK